MSGSSMEEAYTRWAVSYDTDRNLTRDLDRHATREVLSNSRYRSILELGCGTGKNTELLAQIAERVRCLDLSEGMLAQARAKGFGPAVEFTRADLAQPWPVADRWADLICCNLVLEHIADLGFVFAEAARTLVPGGQLFVCELHPFKQYLGSVATFTHNNRPIAVPAFVHHVSDFLDAAARAGFRLERLQEWWHPEDDQKPPRLISFLFTT